MEQFGPLFCPSSPCLCSIFVNRWGSLCLIEFYSSRVWRLLQEKPGERLKTGIIVGALVVICISAIDQYRRCIELNRWISYVLVLTGLLVTACCLGEIIRHPGIAVNPGCLSAGSKALLCTLDARLRRRENKFYLCCSRLEGRDRSRKRGGPRDCSCCIVWSLFSFFSAYSESVSQNPHAAKGMQLLPSV